MFLDRSKSSWWTKRVAICGFSVWSWKVRDLKLCASGSVELGREWVEKVHFDFVIVSQGTSAFEGRTLLDRATAQNRHRPTLVVTRCYDMHCYLEAMQLGAIDYLEKPIHPTDLVQIVRAHALLGISRSRQAQS